MPVRVLAVLLVVLLVLAVVALEWAARVALRRRHGGDRRAPQALRDPFTAWRNNPAFRRADIAHEAHGFRRSTEVALRPAPGTRRVLLLGGSTAYGAQGGFTHIDARWTRLGNDETIDAFLEARLADAAPAGRVEVVNAAVSGYRVHQQLALVESRLRRFRPHDVLSLDGYNDCIALYNWVRGGHRGEFDVHASTPGLAEFDALANPGSARSLLVFADAWLRARSTLFGLLVRHAPGQVRSPWGPARPGATRPRGGEVRLADLTGEERLAVGAAVARIGYYADTARRIHRALDLDGVRPVFLLQPILILSGKPLTEMERRFVDHEWQKGGPLYFRLFRELYDAVDESMAAAAREEGLRYLSLVDVFDATEEQAFSDFAHLTPAGNRIVAERVFRDVFATEGGAAP